MKKILGGILVLLSLSLIGNVKAEMTGLGLNPGESNSQDISVTLNEVDEAPDYMIDLFWGELEFNYVYSGKDSQTGENVYTWEPSEADSNWVGISSWSNVDVELSLAWNSSLSGLTMTKEHYINDMTGTCVPLETDNPESLNTINENNNEYVWGGYYSDSSCQTHVLQMVNGNQYYRMKPVYTSGNSNTSSWVVQGYEYPNFENSVAELMDVRSDAHQKWIIGLSGDISTSSLETGMTLGTITVTIDDID